MVLKSLQLFFVPIIQRYVENKVQPSCDLMTLMT